MIRRAAYLARMLHNETLAPAAIAAGQRAALIKLVRHAALQVPFYRELYAAHGVKIADFQGIEDLQRLPIIDKAMLRAAGEAAVAVDAPARRVRIATSGSTGEPFAFPIDLRYDQWRKAQCLRPYFSCGRRLTDSVLRLASSAARQPWFSHLGLLREWRMPAGSDAARVAQVWRERAPQLLQGYPSSLRLLAQHCLDQGTPLSPAPRLVFTDSEQLRPDTRAILERAFGAPVLDVFGTFETDNIAYECPAHEGYHITTDCVALEVIRDGRPAPAGDPGDIVVTVLGNHTLPFIRYNLHDGGVLAASACSCGRPFPLLAAIDGRADDLLVLPDGQRRSVIDVLNRLDELAASALHYQLHQLDRANFELLLVPSQRFTGAEAAHTAHELGAILAPARLALRLVDAIAQDRSGKRRAFISHVDAAPHA